MKPEDVKDAIKSLLEDDQEVAHSIWLPPISIAARERKGQVVNIATDNATLADLLRFEHTEKWRRPRDAPVKQSTARTDSALQSWHFDPL